MASGKILRQLIKYGAEGNFDAFRRASEEVIKEERDKQHHLLANDLEKILYGRSAQPNGFRNLQEAVPVDRERGFPLMVIREPVRRLEDLVLSDDNRSLLDEIFLEHHRADHLRSFGLHPIDKILFFGPPGCGKTLTAEVIASELNYPFAIIRVDSVVSSYLGETAANLRKVFDYISDNPMVVLFDEFDALAKERSDGVEHGELKRVVNSVLQMMDAYRGKSLIIAATNHEGILDSAIWRRFEEILLFELPNLEQLRRLLSVKLRGVRQDFSTNDNTHLLGSFKGMSHADVERVIIRAIKGMILAGQEFLRISHIDAALIAENARRRRVKAN